MKISIGFVTMFVFVILIVVMAGNLYSGKASTYPSEDVSQVEIAAETVPILYPHEHNIGDSLFDPDHHVRVLSGTLTTQKDLWITSFELVLKNAPPQALHHAGILIPNEANQTCSNSVYGREIYAASTADVNKPIAFQDPYAMFIPKGTPLVLEVLYHNPFPPFGAGEIYKNVSATVVMKTQQGNSALVSKPVEYYRIHVEDTPCPGVVDEEVFVIPAGTENFIKESTGDYGSYPSFYTFSRPGTITYMGAHFHPWEGQEKLDVYLNGKELTTFLADRTSIELWSWTIPHSQTTFRVKSGDVLSFSTTNSNPNPVPVIGAMGMVVFYFAPDVSS